MNQKIVAVVGLGYVGLPLALEFSKNLATLAYDLSGRKAASMPSAGVFINEKPAMIGSDCNILSTRHSNQLTKPQLACRIGKIIHESP